MNRDDLFKQSDDYTGDGNQIFSVTGKPSFRIQRRQMVNSNVFPAGCMGNNEKEVGIASIVEHQEAAASRRPAQPPRGDEHDEDRDEGLEADMAEKDSAGGDDEVDVLAGELGAMKSIGGIGTMGAIASSPMYQYSGSNIQRNPLTGSGCNEQLASTGKRRVLSRFGKKKTF